MAIWRDPLDELIVDLERALPTAAPAPEFEMPPPMEDYCVFGEIIRTRDPAARQRLLEHPAVKRVMAYHQRLARERESSESVEPTS